MKCEDLLVDFAIYANIRNIFGFKTVDWKKQAMVCSVLSKL